MDSDGKANESSSVAGLSRQEFLALVLKRGLLAGAILAAPKVVDKFLVPPVYAKQSRTTGPGGNTDLG